MPYRSIESVCRFPLAIFGLAGRQGHALADSLLQFYSRLRLQPFQNQRGPGQIAYGLLMRKPDNGLDLHPAFQVMILMAGRAPPLPGGGPLPPAERPPCQPNFSIL